MNNDDIQKLIDRYLEGATSPEEERLLAGELLRPDLPEEWKAIRLMLGELAMGEAEYDALMANRKKTAPVVRMRLRWMAVAASLLVLIGIGVTLMPSKDTKSDIQKEPEALVAQTMPKVKQQEQDSISHEKKTPAVRKPRTKVKEKPAVPKVSTVEAIRANNSKDPNLHYASHSTTTDTIPYQAPSRMEGFIAKLADYNHIKAEPLDCSFNKKDSTVISVAYVFEDTKELNLFARLLQAACWYDTKTPGYLLNYSHQQFFFCLKDLRLGLKYLWIAERLNGKILLYGTHSPIDVEVSSECFQRYRDKLSNISSNPKTTEI